MNKDYFIGLNNGEPRVWAREGGIQTIEHALQSNEKRTETRCII